MPISHPYPPIGSAAVAGGHQPLIVGHIHNAADDFKSGLLYSVGFVAAHPADATEPSSNRRERAVRAPPCERQRLLPQGF